MTAVEWLAEKLKIYISSEVVLQEITEQAKVREKEQIELAHIDGGKNKRTAVEYYNDTFKSE